MESDESIKDMYTRFTSNINGLTSPGKTYPNVDLVSKILGPFQGHGSLK